MTQLYSQEQIAAANKANIETLLNFANTTFESAERFAALNLNTARAILEDSVARAKVLLGAKDVQQLFSLQMEQVQPAAEQSVAYARGMYEIVTLTQKAIAEVVEDQLAELNKNLNAALDDAAKNAPAGSELAVAAAKSAIAAANLAYESVGKTAKQVTEIAAANVAAAASAAPQTTAKAAPAAKARKSA